MEKWFFLTAFLVFISCKRDEGQVTDIVLFEAKSQEKNAVQNDTIVYFNKALTYRYEINGTIGELWFYANEQTQQILYVPNDEMIEAIISYPDGKYSIFASDEKGRKIKLDQQVNAVVSSEMDDNVLLTTQEKIVIAQKNIQQKDITCMGYILKYLKMEGGEMLYATTQIPLNSYQIYGFSKLNGDCKLPYNLDYINTFQKRHLITHINREDFKLQLLNYGPTVYEFYLKPYLN